MAKQTVKKEREIKYTDKSPGQPGLIPVFNRLRQILLTFVKGSLFVMSDKPGQFHLHSNKNITINGKKHNEVYFAGLLVQKGYVGFYFMPVYSDAFLQKEIAPELLKCLKGKSCFHIKKADTALEAQIAAALQAGYNCYVKKGWI
ncbi:MAG TPA: hypothetical protein VHB48_18985 [Chitinophagaceae bacterium]|nr:hypothetical protein [Chitinophagaceae bacterium]